MVVCGPMGKFFFFFRAYWETCFDSTHEGVLFAPWGNIFKTHKGVACVSWGSPSMILYFAGGLVDTLNSRGSFLGKFLSAEGCFGHFPFTEDALRVFVILEIIF